MKDPELILKHEIVNESLYMSSSRQPDISSWSGLFNTIKPSKDIKQDLSPNGDFFSTVNLQNEPKNDKKLLPLLKINKKNKRNFSWYTKRSPEILDRIKNRKRGTSDGLSFITREYSPSPELYKEIRACLKQPYMPRRDLKEFRNSIRIAVNKSRTIEELIRSTKIPTTQLLKSSETGTSAVISAFKQFEMGPSLRHGYYRIKKKLF